MAKGRPTGVDTPGGNETVVNAGGSGGAAICATCCLRRTHEERASGNYAEVFTHFGHGAGGSAVSWHAYYYRSTYSYLLGWSQTSSAGASTANGTITVKFRAKLTAGTLSSELSGAAARLGYRIQHQPASSKEIADAYEDWRRDIRARWSNRYVVQLRGTDCPGDLLIDFDFVRVQSGEDQAVALFRMDDPRSGSGIPAEAFSNPTHPNHGTARTLLREYGSDAASMNLEDSRGALVASHEYGHWIGWGDEYTGPAPVATISGSRVAVRFKNPTKVYKDARGTDVEVVMIDNGTVRPGLMANMGVDGRGSNTSYFPRYVFNVVHDFIRRYNRVHHSGRAVAYCYDVRMNRAR
jgi:hypothetical protein